MKDHNCPYQRRGGYCTHRLMVKTRGKVLKKLCNQSNPIKCPYLQSKGKRLLREAIILIGKPFGLEVTNG